ncbi:MAG: calcium-binding protein [Paracoccus aminovorans]|nr:calcium-binding protein [Paracoccus aminovorans]
MTIFINGTAGNDRLRAESTFPYRETIVINGLAGNDILTGSFLNPNALYGGAGRDTLEGGAATNLLDGGLGDDLLRAWQGTGNVLRGGAGNDLLTGGNQGSRLDGGSGRDSMAGGAGGDVYVVDSTLDQIRENYAPRYGTDPNPPDQVQSWIELDAGRQAGKPGAAGPWRDQRHRQRPGQSDRRQRRQQPAVRRSRGGYAGGRPGP